MTQVDNYTKSLEEYIANLSQFKELLESDNYEQIFHEMGNTNRIKEILGKRD